MNEVVLYENGATLAAEQEELLFERVATHYLRLQDERNGRRVRVHEAVAAVLQLHPNEYQEVVAHSAVKCNEFDEYLSKRRKEHLLTRLVPSLYAAEYGSTLGSMAVQRLIEKFENGEELETKDLLAILKVGYELASKVDKQVEEVTGTKDVQVNIDVKTLLLGATPEQLAELGRRAMGSGD